MKLTKVSSRTALRDIEDLIDLGVLEQEEAGGRRNCRRLSGHADLSGQADREFGAPVVNTIGPSFATAVANIPVRHDRTLYSRFGNWFAWVCVALLFVCLFLIARPRSSTGPI
jgi:hypothetical protein